MSEDLLNTLPVPIMDFSPVRDDSGQIVDFSLVWANEASMAPNSVTLEDIVGERILQFAPQLAGSDGFNQMVKTANDGKTRSIVGKAEDSPLYQGKTTKFVTAASVAGCSITMLDVSDVVAERDTARGQLKMMEAACNDAVNGIAIANSDYQMVYANPALCKMLGYTKEEILQLRIGDMMSESESEIRHEQAAKLLSEEIDQYVVDRTYLHKSGEKILMSVAVSTLHEISGGNLSLAHFRDVREERKAQHDLRTALMKAEESTRMKSEFLANMSHEIRTPLNGVIGMAQVLSHSDLTEAQEEHVSIIQDSSTSLLSLLNDILDLSKVEAGKITISPVESDLRHKFSRLYKLHDPIAREKNIELKIAFDPNIPSHLEFDPVRVRQCVSNLVSNAVKFTTEGKVVIAVSSKDLGDEHEVKVHVSDTGIGIPDDKIGRIFEAFQQADGSTTRSYGGTGLGLTITKRLARLMGGDLSVASQFGKGSVFTLTFKAKTPIGYVKPLADAASPGEQSSGQKQALSGRDILVVDDNLINRQVAKTILEIYGFNIEVACDGVEAVEVSQDRQFDLILMDIHMPRMDGVRAVKGIQSGGGMNVNTPIIALTADAMSGDREKYLKQNMQGYVSKPINERELIAEIERVIAGEYLAGETLAQTG